MFKHQDLWHTTVEKERIRIRKLGFLFELTSKDVLDEERNEESEEAVEQITKINNIEFAIIVFSTLTL